MVLLHTLWDQRVLCCATKYGAKIFELTPTTTIQQDSPESSAASSRAFLNLDQPFFLAELINLSTIHTDTVLPLRLAGLENVQCLCSFTQFIWICVQIFSNAVKILTQCQHYLTSGLGDREGRLASGWGRCSLGYQMKASICSCVQSLKK